MGGIMRFIEKKMLEAIKAKKDWHMDNTSVEYLPELNTTMHARIEYAKIFLFGHHIASYDYATGVATANPVTLKHYPTATTKSRLRALGVNVYTRKGVTFLNDKAI